MGEDKMDAAKPNPVPVEAGQPPPATPEATTPPEKKTFDKAKTQLEEQKAKITPDKSNQYEGKADDDTAETKAIEEAQNELDAGKPEKAVALLKAYHQEKSHTKALAAKASQTAREDQPRPNAAEAAEETIDEGELETRVQAAEAATQEQDDLQKILLDLQSEIQALENALTELDVDVSALPDFTKLTKEEQNKLFLESQSILGRRNLHSLASKELAPALQPSPDTQTPTAETANTTPDRVTQLEQRIKQLEEIMAQGQEKKPLTPKQNVIELAKQGGGYALMLLTLMQIFMAEMEK